MAKIKFTLSTNKIGSLCSTVIEVEDEDWAELSNHEKGTYAKEMFWDIALDRLGE